MRSCVLALAMLSFGLAACTAGPDYKRPAAPIAATYKELDGWKVATPKDAIRRGDWWAIYNDPVLDGLVRQVAISNENLKAQEAAFREARAAVRAARAGYYPTLNVDPSVTRSSSGVSSSSIGRPGGTRILRTIYDLPADAGWELDVWGRIRRTVEGDIANAQASAADLASALLSTQAELISDYIQLRTADEQKRLLSDAVEAYTRALQITRNQYNSGVASRADVAQAETQLETTRASLIAVESQRAQFEHAIAVLIGKPPSEFSIAPIPYNPHIPEVPVELPSALLERRPDIAAAERRMAFANAQIGVAEAAYFPTLSLSASFGFTSTALENLLRAGSQAWSLGAAGSAPIFNGGATSASVEQARAAYDQAVATYRQTVLTGFQQVEDQLAALRVLAEQAAVQDNAVRAATEAERLALNQYLGGVTSYTTVVTAQTTALNNRQTALTIWRDRMLASVSLIQALGGDFHDFGLPAGDQLYQYNPLSQVAEQLQAGGQPAAEEPGFWSGFGTAIRNLFNR
ncbi:MAG TPA: efflux transporter outer membrane subunit [Ferrovibrio sp.]|uniref:efflux transporter outer membrane subunit n=1 Tax=Ferrovibrio sp. TaxID=1917215 RepID=UPI002ED1657E